jgi:hypothetical protein
MPKDQYLNQSENTKLNPQNANIQKKQIQELKGQPKNSRMLMYQCPIMTHIKELRHTITSSNQYKL